MGLELIASTLIKYFLSAIDIMDIARNAPAKSAAMKAVIAPEVLDRVGNDLVETLQGILKSGRPINKSVGPQIYSN